MGARKRGALEVAPLELRPREVGAGEVLPREIGAAETHLGEIRGERGPFGAPLVPVGRLHAFEMFRVHDLVV